MRGCLFILLSSLVACGAPPAENGLRLKPVQPETSTTTLGSTSTSTTTTTSPVVTIPARGIQLIDVDSANAITDCTNLNPAFSVDPLEDFGGPSWTFTLGVNGIDPVLSDLGLDPSTTVGAVIEGDLVEAIATAAYGFEIDANRVLSSNPASIPSVSLFHQYGLAEGYHVMYVPWAFGFGSLPDTGPRDTAQPGSPYMEISLMTMELYLGGTSTGELEEVTLEGFARPSMFVINLATIQWDGDPNTVDEYCSLIYFLDGRTVTPIP